MKKLSIKEKQTLNAIKKFIDKYGFSPSVRELGEILGNSSPATVNSKLKKLREKGFITWIDGKYRTIKIIYDKEE